MFKKYGWKRDLPDRRDRKFKVEHLAPIQSVYLAHKYKLPLPYDQLSVGSCTANALAFAIHFDLLNKHDQKVIVPWTPSRLFIYYNERMLEGTIDQDTGAEIRDGIKTLVTYGTCSEDAWPYNIDQFATKPSSYAYSLAKAVTAVRYESLDNTNKQELINALLQGFPIVFGMSVYESFESFEVLKTGIIPMPSDGERMIGGHAMSIVGYRMEDDTFIVRNSWGINFGQGGYCRIPAAYLCDANLADDFWVLYSVV